MEEALIEGVVIALIVSAVKAVTSEGQILSFVKTRAQKVIDYQPTFATKRSAEIIFKPILFCALCMTSFWGTIFEAARHTPEATYILPLGYLAFGSMTIFSELTILRHLWVIAHVLTWAMFWEAGTLERSALAVVLAAPLVLIVQRILR